MEYERGGGLDEPASGPPAHLAARERFGGCESTDGGPCTQRNIARGVVHRDLKPAEPLASNERDSVHGGRPFFLRSFFFLFFTFFFYFLFIFFYYFLIFFSFFFPFYFFFFFLWRSQRSVGDALQQDDAGTILGTAG
jgi:hypothetical protein